jgi:NUMOD3 motif
LANTFIYALHDPRDWEIRYVGKSNNPERRHRKPRSHNRALQNFISELRALGLKPRVSILQKCSFDQWQNWERFWIATVKAAGEKLLNLHPGGDGPTEARAWNKGLKLSDEQKSKLVLPHPTTEQCRAARLGKKDSEETRLKKSLAAKGRKHSLEHCIKVSIAQKGRKFSEEHKEKLRAAKLGTKQSPETIEKRMEKMKVIRRSSNYREKMQDAALKRWYPEVPYAV